jgi:hypothetical protein
MALVIKGNRQYTIAEEKIKEYLILGFSQINEKGEIIQPGQAITLKDIKEENATIKAKLAIYQENADKLDQFEEVQKENEDLKAQVAALNGQIADLSAQLETANKGKK